MKKNILTKTFTCFLFVCLFLSCQKKSELVVLPIEVAADTVKVPDEYQDMADLFLDTIHHAMTEMGCPGLAIAIVHDSSTLALRGFGVEDNITMSPVLPETVFRLGSVSKGFAAVLTQILVKEGYLSWDDPIIKYIPEFSFNNKTQSDKISIKNLLSQSTGLPPHTYTNFLEAGSNIADILPMLTKVKAVADTGAICTYQNVAYGLIELILERATGKPYSTLLKEKIFDPLLMKNVSTSCDAIAHANHKSSPHKFQWKEKKYLPVSFNEKYYNAISAGGINASISDMQNYIQLMLGNRSDILSEKELSSFFEPNVASNYERRYFHHWEGLTHDYYALGWRLFDYSGETWAYHGGFVNAFRAEIAINLRRKVGVCMLFNSSCGLPDYAMKIFFDRFGQERMCRQEQL